MKILVFLHGTSIMHQSGIGRAREERVRQVVERDPSVRDYASYVPVEHAVGKVHAWADRGAEIAYLSSHRTQANLEKDRTVLRQWGFPEGPVYFREQPGERYADVVERILPDVIVEDDCESIPNARERELVYAQLRPDLQRRIKSIIVPEFVGIDHLPDEPAALLTAG